jgi:uncharacterized protein YbjT (DUF2867 family)
MPPTLFITGATGNIGIHLTKLLTEQNTPFTAGVTRNTGEAPFPVAIINYAQPDRLEEAFAGHSILYLLIPDDERALDWAAHAITAARKAGINHLVRSSGIGAAAHSPYQVLWYLGQIEDMVRESGLDYTIVRPRGKNGRRPAGHCGTFASQCPYPERGYGATACVLSLGGGRVSL